MTMSFLAVISAVLVMAWGEKVATGPNAASCKSRVSSSGRNELASPCSTNGSFSMFILRMRSLLIGSCSGASRLGETSKTACMPSPRLRTE